MPNSVNNDHIALKDDGAARSLRAAQAILAVGSLYDTRGWNGTRPHYPNGPVVPIEGKVTCVRVYNNGSWAYEPRLPDEVYGSAEDEGWIAYNKTWRPGCALFVDGECVELGYLSPERAQAITDRLLAGKIEPTDFLKQNGASREVNHGS